MAALAEVGQEISATLDVRAVLERIGERVRSSSRPTRSRCSLRTTSPARIRAILAHRRAGRCDAGGHDPRGRGDRRRRHPPTGARVRQRHRCRLPNGRRSPAPRITTLDRAAHGRAADRPRPSHRCCGGLALRAVRRSPRPTSTSSSGSPGRRRSRIENARLYTEAQEAHGRGRGRQPGEERVPRRDEPRDPDADERGHRDERPAPRDGARPGAARLRRDDPDVGRRAAHDHQRHPRLLEDRGRQGRPRGRAVLAPRRRSRAPSTSIAPIASRKGVELAYAMGDGLPEAIVGDAGRLRQIVLNLLSNAIKFTEQGEVVLSVDATLADARAGARGRSTIEVRDTGIGIPPGPDGPALPVVQPGRRVDHAALRRDGPGAGDQPPPGRVDGRHADRDEQRHRRARAARSACVLPVHGRRRCRTRCRRRRSGASAAAGCWSSTTTRRTAGSSRASSSAGASTAAATASPHEAIAWVRDGQRRSTPRSSTS